LTRPDARPSAISVSTAVAEAASAASSVSWSSVPSRPSFSSPASRPGAADFSLGRVDVAGPRLRVGGEDDVVDRHAPVERVQHRQGAVGAAEGQVVDPAQDVVEPLAGREVERDQARGHAMHEVRTGPVAVAPRGERDHVDRWLGRQRDGRHRRRRDPGREAHDAGAVPPSIEADTSRASSVRFPAGSTLATAA
jgi:hypothetical protein